MKVTSYLTAFAAKLAAAGMAVIVLAGAPAPSHAAPPAPNSADDAVHKADEHKGNLHKESTADKAARSNHTDKAASAVDRTKSDAASGVNSAKERATNAARSVAKDTNADDSRGRDRDRDRNAGGTDRSNERRDDANDRRNGGQRDRDANSGRNRAAGDNRNDRSNEQRRFSTDRNLRNENLQGRDRDDRNAENRNNENRNDRDRNRDNRNGNDRDRDDRNVQGRNVDRNGRAAVGANGQVRGGAGVNTRGPNLGIGWGNAAGGLVVSSIAARSLGAGMGLRQGDQIVSVGGRQFNNQAAFNQYLFGVRPGVRLPLIVSRGGQQQTLYWTPTSDFVQAYQVDDDDRDVQQPAGNQLGQAYLGVQFDTSVHNAAVIAAVTPDGPADKAGLQPGDAILGINGQDVHSPRDVTQLVSQLQPGDSAKLSIGHQAVSDVDVELGARPQAGGVQAQPNVQPNQLAPPPAPNGEPVQGQPAPRAPQVQPAGLPPQPATPGVVPAAPDAPPAPPANVNGGVPQVQPSVQPAVQPVQPPAVNAPGPVRGRVLNRR